MAGKKLTNLVSVSKAVTLISLLFAVIILTLNTFVFTETQIKGFGVFILLAVVGLMCRVLIEDIEYKAQKKKNVD